MLNHYRRREPIPTDLSWEEKHPVTYLYEPSEAMKWLQQRVEHRKKSNHSKPGEPASSSHEG